MLGGRPSQRRPASLPLRGFKPFEIYASASPIWKRGQDLKCDFRAYRMSDVASLDVKIRVFARKSFTDIRVRLQVTVDPSSKDFLQLSVHDADAAALSLVPA